jgi:DNA polymerase V
MMWFWHRFRLFLKISAGKKKLRVDLDETSFPEDDKKEIMVTKINSLFCPDQSTEHERPFFMIPVTAGFPSPAEDYIEGKLDLNKHLIKHPSATFFVRVTGDSMIDAGIYPGDILIVDRAIEPDDKKVVVAVIDGDLTLKRIRMIKGKVFLMPENEDYDPLEIKEEMNFEIWGVVTNVIHPL